MKSLSFNFNISIHNVQYLRRLIDKHGYITIRNRKKQYCSNEFKELTLNKKLKRKLIQGSKFETPEQAQKEIFKYIEVYYTTSKSFFIF